MAERAHNIIDVLEHSNTQERYAIGQVSKVFCNSGILPDSAQTGKKEAMDANRAAGAKTSHDIHAGTPIGWNSYHTYGPACVPLAIFARQEGIKDMYQLTPQVLSGYLQFAIDCEVKFATFDKNCSAYEKLCECINSHNGTSTDFHKIIDSFRKQAKEELPASDYTKRSYDNPTAIIDNLPPSMQVTADLQLYCGLRISDACHIKAENWDGKNLFVENSKNGQNITVTPPQWLADKLTAILQNGDISVNRSAYDYRLEKACNATDQAWAGSHGFRHNYCQARMEELTGQGCSFYQALQIVSEEMGHHRPDITKWYLR